MIIDLHCDTLNKLYKKEECLITKEKLIKGNYLMQIFALFYNTNNYEISPINEMINIYYTEFSNNHINNINDLLRNKNNNIISTMLALEDGGYIKNIEDLYYLYYKGVRLICLTWNNENNIGYPHTINKNLKPFGIKLIKEMEKLNMIICVSHLSKKGFYDVYNNTKKPFIASHSNCFNVCNHTRNLTDDMIIKINERKGLIGINYYNKFVSNEETTYIDDLIKHIKHIKNIASIDIISLGSDFDGIDNEVEFSVDTISIFQEKLKQNFTTEEVDKICYKNALNFLKTFLI